MSSKVKKEIVPVDVPTFGQSIVQHDLRSFEGIERQYANGSVKIHTTLPMKVGQKTTDAIVIKRRETYTVASGGNAGQKRERWQYALVQSDRRGNAEVLVEWGGKQDVTRLVASIIAQTYTGAATVMSAGAKWNAAMEHAKAALK